MIIAVADKEKMQSFERCFDGNQGIESPAEGWTAANLLMLAGVALGHSAMMQTALSPQLSRVKGSRALEHQEFESILQSCDAAAAAVWVATAWAACENDDVFAAEFSKPVAVEFDGKWSAIVDPIDDLDDHPAE